MSFVWAEPQFRRAAALRQPRCVRAGHEPILGAVHEQDGGAYLP